MNAFILKKSYVKEEINSSKMFLLIDQLNTHQKFLSVILLRICYYMQILFEPVNSNYNLCNTMTSAITWLAHVKNKPAFKYC